MSYKLRQILYYPPRGISNSYAIRVQELLAQLGGVEPIDKLPGIKKALLHMLRGKLPRYDIVWINFIENRFLYSGNGRIDWLNTLKIFVKTFFVTRFAKLAVFVRHDHYPHHAHPKHRKLVKRLVDCYECMFDTVVTHSGAEADGHRIYCPHPLYKHDDSPAAAVDFALPSEYFVVFGRMLPYKQIEQILPVFPQDKFLLVIGAAEEEYLKKLLAQPKPNVLIQPGHLPENVAQHIIKGSNGVVITNAERDMIVSGTFFYAMTLGKPVFALETDFYRWIKPTLAKGLLYIANDLSTLCQMIQQYQAPPQPAENLASIQQHFGDAVVIETLRRILKLTESNSHAAT